MSGQCSFCESLRYSRQYEAKDDRLRTRYMAKYVQITYRDLDRIGKWEIAGEITSRKYPLNFCPECGKAVTSE